ncbi:YtkA-like [Lentibacillus persicus]|uniref:YtkA-like n=1 Tax=Lentibacillus persicus TaxID=640948 RepID=A0A1I1WNC3_9BACI|nr:FixH family protein [Lentibacillus persicus]SFD96471.1 YtkA-like [Lentibacillus persicus]
MRKIMIAVLILLISILAACGQNEETGNDTTETDTTIPIEADLEVAEQAEKDEEVTFTVTVTQDGETISDANEVTFEIWEDGNKEESEMIEADNAGDGKYTVEKSFDTDAVYHVQSHVTARTMHTMPVKQIAIGGAEAETQSSEDKQSES